MNDRQSAASNGVVDRRDFIRVAAGGMALAGLSPIIARAAPRPPELSRAIAKLEPYFTAAGKFQDVSRGKPLPHSLPDEKKREVGLTRDTWKLEVISDPGESGQARQATLTKADGTALDFAAPHEARPRKHAVRFAKVMTCLNIGCPLGMGIWEGVPLRDVIWLTKPREDVRRVFYYGYHNDDPKQMFRSSLPIGRVLEDPFDLPPVILCYKLNGQWLDSRARRAGADRRARGLRLQVDQMAHARRAHQPAACQRHLRRGEQRRRQPAQDVRRDARSAERSPGGPANSHHRLCPGRHLRPIEGAGLDHAEHNELADRRRVFHDGPLERC